MKRNTESQRLAFERIAKAIRYLEQNYQNQPSLAEVASAVNLSEYHFQRLFKEWTAVSPKKFLQHLCLTHAKSRLRDFGDSLLTTSLDMGFSGPSRLHDLFISIESMTPGEYKNKGEGLCFDYEFATTPLGTVLLTSTQKGISHLAFATDETEALDEFFAEFPNSSIRENSNSHHEKALRFFHGDWTNLEKTKLHLKATPFQLKVWQGLLRIPVGQTESYGDLASSMNQPNAARAVGSAIGANPVAYLIPCHRVIRASGELGGYRWGLDRKKSLLSWDAASSK